MCALFGHDVAVYDVPLRIRAAAAVGGVPGFDLVEGRMPHPNARLVEAPPAFPAPVLVAADLADAPVALRAQVPERVDPPAAIHALAWPPILAPVRLPAVPPFIAPLRHEGTIAPPAVHEDLEAARKQPVRKRMVPAARLAPEAATQWLRRLADSKKMARTRLELVGVFLDVPIADGQPVKYDAHAGAIAYPPPEGPIPPSTVVVARRTDTGVAVVGRFYR